MIWAMMIRRSPSGQRREEGFKQKHVEASSHDRNGGFCPYRLKCKSQFSSDLWWHHWVCALLCAHWRNLQGPRSPDPGWWYTCRATDSVPAFSQGTPLRADRWKWSQLHAASGSWRRLSCWELETKTVSCFLSSIVLGSFFFSRSSRTTEEAVSLTDLSLPLNWSRKSILFEQTQGALWHNFLFAKFWLSSCILD